MSDECDSEEHYYSGSDEDDESNESDSDDANHGLLDLEASEGSSDPESDADQYSDDGSYVEYSFPKFMQLPPEIREMVWGAFCPDLGSEPRVFELHLRTVISPPGAVHLPNIVQGIVAGPQLESQTKPVRAVLAVHRESRELALKSAPHELSLSDGELVHYHEERDVLFVAWTEEILLRGIALRFQELGIEAQNLAFPSDITSEYGEDLADLMYLLPQTRRLFLLDEEESMQDESMSIRDYAWTVADKVHKYHLHAEEESDIGFLVPANRIICWPDLDNHREFAEEHVTDPDGDFVLWSTVNDYRHRLRNPLEDSRELNQDYLSDEEKTEAIGRLRSIEVWPMVRFNFREGLNRFNYIETRARSFPDQMSESESPRNFIHIPDEYESDGIDDDPIDDSTSVDDYDEMLAQNLAQQFFQPHGSSGQLDNSSEIDELPPANFSSDEEPEEPDQVTYVSDSEDGSASQTRAARAMRRVVESDSEGSATEAQSPRPSKRRSRAAISDSEDNEEDSSDAGPVRGANRRARAIPIDSEDEDEQDGDDAPQPSRADRRRGRVVPIDSDDDDDEEGSQKPSEGRKSRRRVVQEGSDKEGEGDDSDSQGGGAKTKESGSSDEEEQSSSDDEDDDPPPPKRMSLAKRLRMESRQDQSRHVDHDSSEADGMNGDGYDYSDDQEDEVDKSDTELFEGEDGESEGGY
ncbi:hypothetical protein INS49_013896 [Diaporthe citri]|uniref:uncharacterized protein n=1 Tax=Diaporthe citri TaxID=83186 RepID=UPI001C811B26|nr:uncharacterized protein INS49_013896 [Diaporthe citri]KAG6358013.1 hypothetical protein INS49_013896 [Diaporthe citri]